MRNIRFSYPLILSSMLLVFLYLSCEESNEPEILWDPSFFIDGMVLDSTTQGPISEVLVFFSN